MLDLSSNYCFHLRITADKQKCKETLEAFIKKWEPVAMISGFELSKSDVSHCHVHLEYTKELYDYHNSDKGKVARGAFFKKNDLVGLYNFQKLNKQPINNILYVIKARHIILQKNITEEEICSLFDKTTQIEESKKLDTRHKILEEFKQHITKFKFEELPDDSIEDTDEQKQKRIRLGQVSELSYIALFIHKLYVVKWDKDPPLSNVKSYVLYVAEKINQLDLYVKYDIVGYYQTLMGIMTVNQQIEDFNI